MLHPCEQRLPFGCSFTAQGRLPIQGWMSLRILIVDDDEALRESLELVLSAEDYEVVAAPDGASALALLEKGPVDVVLCDLRMPGVDGL